MYVGNYIIMDAMGRVLIFHVDLHDNFGPCD